MRTWTLAASLVFLATIMLALVACDDPTSPPLSPGPVDNLEAAPRGNTVTLTWTAPGDDPASGGRVSRYEARYWAAWPSAYDWESAIPAGQMDAVADPGGIESMTISNLPYDSMLVFAVKAFDDADNASDVRTCGPTWTGLQLVREFEVADDASELEIDADGNVYLLTRQDHFYPPIQTPGLTKLLSDGTVAWQWQPSTACDGYDVTSTIAVSVEGIYFGWACAIWHLDSGGEVQSEWIFPDTGLRADAILSIRNDGVHVAGAGKKRRISRYGELHGYIEVVPWSSPNTYALGEVGDYVFLLLHADCGEYCLWRFPEYWPTGAPRSCELSPAPGELLSPQGMSSGRRNRMYVVDSNPAVGVQVFGAGGQFITRWEVFGGRDIAVAENGEVYVLAERPEDGARVVQVFGPE